MDLKVIFDSSYDVIFVADKNGKALRVSSACEKFWGIKKEDFIGSNVFKLEEQGVFSPSITRMVLEQKKKISTIQKTNTGRTLLVVGTPIMDETGNIQRIVNASRDITEIGQLQKELSETKDLLERYQGETNQSNGNNIPSEVPPYKLEVYDDLDLYKTLKSIEQQILEYTISKYKTTVEIAKALNVSQSTISKKLNKLGISIK
jgi:PAS domain S-box-containing protein